jgi:hypothetical protein
VGTCNQNKMKTSQLKCFFAYFNVKLFGWKEILDKHKKVVYCGLRLSLPVFWFKCFVILFLTLNSFVILIILYNFNLSIYKHQFNLGFESSLFKACNNFLNSFTGGRWCCGQVTKGLTQVRIWAHLLFLNGGFNLAEIYLHLKSIFKNSITNSQPVIK